MDSIKTIPVSHEQIVYGYSDTPIPEITHPCQTLTSKSQGMIALQGIMTRYFNEEIVFVLDADIILPRDILQQIEHVVPLLSRFPLIVWEQKGDRRHSSRIRECIQVALGLEFGYPRGPPFGIAGGAFLTTRETFCKGTWPHLDGYGPDDTLFFKSLWEMGVQPVVCLDYAVVHPREDDQEYITTKREAMKDYFRQN